MWWIIFENRNNELQITFWMTIKRLFKRQSTLEMHEENCFDCIKLFYNGHKWYQWGGECTTWMDDVLFLYFRFVDCFGAISYAAWSDRWEDDTFTCREIVKMLIPWQSSASHTSHTLKRTNDLWIHFIYTCVRARTHTLAHAYITHVCWHLFSAQRFAKSSISIIKFVIFITSQPDFCRSVHLLNNRSTPTVPYHTLLFIIIIITASFLSFFLLPALQIDQHTVIHHNILHIFFIHSSFFWSFNMSLWPRFIRYSNKRWNQHTIYRQFCLYQNWLRFFLISMGHFYVI